MLNFIENLGHHHDLPTTDTLTLPYEDRSKGRLKTVTDSGEEAGLFLERGKVLMAGDVLKSECGRLVAVKAEPEPVITASCEDWLIFARACYHLGNRHVALEVGEKKVRFQPDHVLEDLARRLGLTTVQEKLPFNPENGAYGGGHHHH